MSCGCLPSSRNHCAVTSRSLATSLGLLHAWQPKSPRRRSALQVGALGSVSRCRIGRQRTVDRQRSRRRAADASSGEPTTAAPTTTSSRPRPRVFPLASIPSYAGIRRRCSRAADRSCPVVAPGLAGTDPSRLPIGVVLASVIVGRSTRSRVALLGGLNTGAIIGAAQGRALRPRLRGRTVLIAGRLTVLARARAMIARVRS
jgi:hypothetical protein